jgi:uncharacterized protein
MEGFMISPIFLIGIGFMVIGMIVSGILKSKFNKYSKQTLGSGMSGREIAEKMLKDHGIYDVKITCVKGKLTDHYNPMDKTVNLSEAVYHGRSTASAAVAAHECGHAVQHATSYSMLELRSKLVPLQNISGTIINVIVMASIFGGAFLFSTFPMDTVLYLIIGSYSVMTLFTFVTLPVEFDASQRALIWIRENGVVSHSEYEESKDALNWAAMTYVVAAIGALTTLLYYVSLLMGRD